MRLASVSVESRSCSLYVNKDIHFYLKHAIPCLPSLLQRGARAFLSSASSRPRSPGNASAISHQHHRLESFIINLIQPHARAGSRTCPGLHKQPVNHRTSHTTAVARSRTATPPNLILQIYAPEAVLLSRFLEHTYSTAVSSHPENAPSWPTSPQ